MKKLVILVFAAAVALAACSKNKKDNSNENYAATGYNAATQADAANVKGGAKYQIIDQEFDNMLAPGTDYDALPAYELQACGDSYLPPVDAAAVAAAKGKARGKAQASGKAISTKTTRAKQVKNTTNIYYVDGPNPNVPVSSTTTTKTVYKSGAVSSSTTASSNSKTVTNPDGSVTTTTVSY